MRQRTRCPIVCMLVPRIIAHNRPSHTPRLKRALGKNTKHKMGEVVDIFFFLAMAGVLVWAAFTIYWLYFDDSLDKQIEKTRENSRVS